MRALSPLAAVAFVVFISCSVPEMEQREPKISMASRLKETNALQLGSSAKPRTLREHREAHANRQPTPFQSYDDKMIGAIRKRWWKLLDVFPSRSRGHVVLEF